MIQGLKGWKTVIFGLFMAIAPTVLTYVAGIDWTSLGISPAVGAIIGGIVIGLRTVTTTPITKSGAAIFLLVGASIALAACQGGARQTGIDISQDGAVGIQRNLSPADILRLKDACTVNAPALISAIDKGAPKTVSDVAIYPYSFCYQLLTGQQNNADQSSLAWLPQVLGMVNTAATVAKFALPLVLPLL